MEIYQVDSFTDEIFKGNPAGVCILAAPVEEQWMQSVAMEMNLSETAFLYRQDGGFNLRWFTPATEVDLCGHATLASAHILWESKVIEPSEEAVFFTKSGRLSARKDGEYIILDFPAEEDEKVEAPEEIRKAIDAEIVYAGFNRTDYIVEVENEETVRRLQPDFEILKGLKTRGVIVTSRSSDPEYDFVSRFFAPGIGIREDPVTGSAHCSLGPYWGKKLGKEEMAARQVSKRGGVLKVLLKGGRVNIAGKAVTVFGAELAV